jgi:C4-dicarboxylate transporter DctQ subunit
MEANSIRSRERRRQGEQFLTDSTKVDVQLAHPPHYQRYLFWLGTRIADIGLWTGAAALLAIVALNAINILLRYFFRSPLSWAEEAMLYLMILGVYVGAISVAWQQAHIRIDAILDFAPPARRKILEVISTGVLAAVLIPVVFASFRVVSLLFDFDQRSDALNFPMWIAQSVVPISLLLIIVMSLLRVFVQLVGADSRSFTDRKDFTDSKDLQV